MAWNRLRLVRSLRVPPPFLFHPGHGSDRLRPPVVSVHFAGDAYAFAFEHARDSPGATPDLDSSAAQPLEGLDAGPVDETDARKLETHRTPRSKEIGAFMLEQGGPLRGDASFESQRHPGV